MPTTDRAHNFNAGPSALPLEVLQTAQEELVNFQGAGMSIMEASHRSPLYENVHNEAIALLKELLGIPSDYQVLFLQGGASLQFSMVPMNFLPPEKTASYVLTGSFAQKAFEEAQLIGEARVAASGKADNYRAIPALDKLQLDSQSAYLHLTSNNTIYGTQWREFPDTGHLPLIADMSSDILSRSIDINQFSLIYAGAQKNLGPSGVTVVILRPDLLERANSKVPTMLRYETFVKNNSLYNTPPTFGIYMLGLVLKWVKKLGGTAEMEKRNRSKAELVYTAIDNSQGFYEGHAGRNSRSLMNVTFRLPSEDLTKRFLEQAKQEGFVGLGGHRSVGGCRASLYNAVPAESCQALAQFMRHFQETNG